MKSYEKLCTKAFGQEFNTLIHSQNHYSVLLPLSSTLSADSTWNYFFGNQVTAWCGEYVVWLMSSWAHGERPI